MRRAAPALLLVTAIVGMVAVLPPRAGQPAPPAVQPALLRPSYLRRLDSLDQALAALADLQHGTDPATAHRAFRRARAAYKRVEFLVESDAPYEAAVLNIAPLPRLNEDDRAQILQPTGFQVIEQALYPRIAPDFAEVARAEARQMRLAMPRLRAALDTAPPERHAFDAVRLELARVATLGLSGFDASLSKDGLLESAEALRGMREGLVVYDLAMRERDPTAWRRLCDTLAAATVALETAPDFDRFDRLAFITRFVNPIADGLAGVERTLGLPGPTARTAWALRATNIYAPAAIDPTFFAPDYAPPPSPELIALGRRLFFDPALSRGGRRSCATCHEPARAFTDGRARAQVDPGHGFVRNTPTLLNAGLQLAQFADQRVPFLEFQAEAVMSNAIEMALPPALAAGKLREDSSLRSQFGTVFRDHGDAALSGRTIPLAIAAYVRSLRAMDSRFDRAVRGDTTALTPSERHGLDLFMGKAACASCHFPPLFGGTQPPTYLQSEPEVIGVPSRPLRERPRLDPDLGAYAADRSPLHRHAFKTPSVRNVELTAPYMHNGVLRTLREVVEFYDRGGGAGLGLRVPNQTLSPEPLHLSSGEKRDLVAFLRALTDSAAGAADTTR
jgi:cytochrome c peroxidase